MNIDSGLIKLWSDLTDEERESGRWVKLGEDELARAITMEEHERLARFNEIFGQPREKEMRVLKELG